MKTKIVNFFLGYKFSAQVTGLTKIAAFYRNRNLYEKRQADVRRECLGNLMYESIGNFKEIGFSRNFQLGDHN